MRSVTRLSSTAQRIPGVDCEWNLLRLPGSQIHAGAGKSTGDGNRETSTSEFDRVGEAVGRDEVHCDGGVLLRRQGFGGRGGR